MTDQIVENVNALIALWKPRLGLDNWKVVVEITPVITRGDGKYMGSAGLCTPQWQYMLAELNFAGDRLAELSANDLEEVVVHELMHVVLSELETTGEKKEERVATMLTAALLAGYGYVSLPSRTGA